MKRINRAFPQLILLSLGVPFLVGLAITGTLPGGLTGLLWGGFARIFIQHHVTWSVNSICHFLGTRRFAVDDPAHAARRPRVGRRPDHPGSPRAEARGARGAAELTRDEGAQSCRPRYSHTQASSGWCSASAIAV